MSRDRPRLLCAPAIEGRRDGARKRIGDIYDWFTEGFDTAELRDARALP